MKIGIFLICLFQLWLINNANANEDNTPIVIPPLKDDNFTNASFKFWTPSSIGKINGLIVLLPGWGGDGTKLTDNKDWQLLASKLNCALVSCDFQSDATMPDYFLAECGSGRALVDAIQQFGSNHQWGDCSQIPVAFCGYSAGGQFAFNFARWKPQRVLAVIAIKGGIYEDADSPDLFQIPMLFIAGQRDEDYRQKALKSLALNGRIKNAPWCIAMDQLGHEMGHAYDLAIPFIEGCFRLRKPDDDSSIKSDEIMLSLGTNVGVLIDTSSHQSYTPLEYPGESGSTIWVPNEHVAAILHNYGRKE